MRSTYYAFGFGFFFKGRGESLRFPEFLLEEESWPGL
jgi:hypothetical protein